MANALPPADSCVDSTCDDQVSVQVPGPAGAAGAAGTNGTDGDNAWTTLTATFTMPAVTASGTATVASNEWMAYGQVVAIGDPAGVSPYAYMRVGTKTGTTQVSLTNLETAGGAYADNVVAGTVFPVGTIVSPGGLQGVAGTDGTSGADADAYYVVTRATDAPVNSTDIGNEIDGTYFLKSTVASSVSTLSSESAATHRTSLGLGTMATQAAGAVAITGGSVVGITDITVADGGTGASDAATARSNLGLGTIATQAASSVAISGGSITGITDLAVADGGTGASTGTAARSNLGVGDAYASLYEDTPAGTTINVVSAGTYYKWSSSTVGQDTGASYLDADATSNDITVGANGAGIVAVSLNASFSGTGNAVVQGAVFKNGTRQSNLAFTRKLSVGGDVGAAAVGGILSVVNTDVIDVRFTSDSNGDNVDVVNVDLSVYRIN